MLAPLLTRTISLACARQSARSGHSRGRPEASAQEGHGGPARAGAVRIRRRGSGGARLRVCGAPLAARRGPNVVAPRRLLRAHGRAHLAARDDEHDRGAGRGRHDRRDGGDAVGRRTRASHAPRRGSRDRAPRGGRDRRLRARDRDRGNHRTALVDLGARDVGLGQGRGVAERPRGGQVRVVERQVECRAETSRRSSRR